MHCIATAHIDRNFEISKAEMVSFHVIPIERVSLPGMRGNDILNFFCHLSPNSSKPVPQKAMTVRDSRTAQARNALTGLSKR